MHDMTWFTLISTVAAALAIALGAMIPALAMGRAIVQALDALARQPEAEKSITRTLFIGLAMIESLAIYVLVVVLIILFRNPLLQYLVQIRVWRGTQLANVRSRDHQFPGAGLDIETVSLQTGARSHRPSEGRDR